MKKILWALTSLLIISPAFVFAEDFEEVKPREKDPQTVKSEPTLTKTQNKRKNVISGEFKLETAAKQKDPYSTSQDAAILFLTSLQTSIKSLAGGNVAKAKDIDESGMHFLTTTYLYCSVNNGVCAYILDSLLEADVINARIDKKDSCPTLRQFWKKYLSNDLESRHKYATKIGFLAETGEFNTKSRPKYIKCPLTVKEERSGTMSDVEYFKARYANGSKIEAVNKSIDYINSLKDKNIHIFNEISNLR